MPGPLIDVTRLLYRHVRGRLPTGIDRVSLQYVRHYARHGRAVVSWQGRTLVLPRHTSSRVFGRLLGSNGCAPVEGEAGRVLLNTAHYGLECPGYAAGLRRRGTRLVAFVHDLIPVAYPQYVRAGDDARHGERMKNALSFAAGIVVNSRDTLDTLQRFAVAAKLACPPALVAPLASCLPQLKPGPRPIEQPYFVMLATIEPRKNHLLILNAWRRLAARHGADTPRLLLVGQRGWKCENVIAMLNQCEELRNHVIERAACNDAELTTALHHARALLLPSLAEGYGMPVVEALSHGVPVIASDLAVFREFAGAIPDYLDPRDESAWIDAITDYAAEGSARRRAQQARLAAFRAPTWDEHMRAVGGFLAQIAQ